MVIFPICRFRRHLHFISINRQEGYHQGNMTVLSSGRLGLLGAGPGYGGPAFLWTPAKFGAKKILLQNLELKRF